MKRWLISVVLIGMTFLIVGCGKAHVDANAGEDQTVYAMSLVTLDGSKSLTSKGKLKYQWTQIKGKKLKLKNPQSAVATFIAPNVTKTTTFVFRLYVKAVHSLSSTVAYDDIKVIVEPTRDTQAPQITLIGDNPINLKVGETYTEPGARVTDNVDKDIKVTISGNVDTSKVGTYTIIYSAKDKAGNEAKATRTVNILEDQTNPEIKKLKDMLDDPSVAYTTDEDFNQTEYAKHHISDDEAKKLERTHMLVATAKDPDPEWCYTDVDKSVIVTSAGTEHTIHLKKMRKDGTVYAPVDNDKLRLVVRVQRSKNNFEYITNINMDQYAHWDGAGILKINVPQDLDRGRLIVGVRPNFDDVATSAIAERWSTVIIAEVWQAKAGVIEVDSSNVLFPIDNASLKGLSTESQFTLAKIAKKVQIELTVHNTLLFPMVVKNMSLSKDDMVSYTFQNKPYAGQVVSIEHKGDQDFVLLAPKFFDVYNITDADDRFMIKEGLYPENVIIREGDRLDSDQNESDPVSFKKALAKGIKPSGIIEHCSVGKGVLNINTVFTIDPLDVGLDLSVLSLNKETKCEWVAGSEKLTLNPAYFAVGGPVAIAMKALGMHGELSPFGKLEIVTKNALGFGIETGYSIAKGAQSNINYPHGLGSIELKDKASEAEIEVSGTFGVKFEVKALGKDGGVGWVLDMLGIEIDSISAEATSGLKAAFVSKMYNATAVKSKNSSSEVAVSLGLDMNAKLSETLMPVLNYFGVETTAEIKHTLNLIDPLKAKADFYFSSVYDNGQGQAHVRGLLPKSYAIHLLTSNDYEGVLSLSDKTSSVWDKPTKNIGYELSECAKNPDYKIKSPAIACAGWMCGMVDRQVELCKGKLSISDVVAHAKITKIASGKAKIINKSGDITATVSGNPLKPEQKTVKLTTNKDTVMTFSKRCPSTPGVYRGNSHISAGKFSDDASNIMVCHDDDTHGDPHIVTGDKLGYDYYASGDYVLSRVKDISGYEIQARFLPGYKTSWPQAVALQVGADVVEIQGVKRDGHGDGSGVPINALAIWVNGKKGILGTDNRYSHWKSEDSISKRIAKLPSGGIIAVTHTDSSNVLSFASNLTIIWPEGSPTQNYGVVLSVAQKGDPFVHIQIARPDDYAGQERGLMGNNDGDPKNDFIRRNGEVLGVDHNISFTELYALFGADWLVRPYESLFRNPEAIKPQFPTDVVTLTPEQRRLGEQACGALTGFYREACIIDVGLTGNADIVKEYYAHTEDLNYLSEQIVTPSVDEAYYSMSVADRAYEIDSGYYLHYKQAIHIVHEAGQGQFMLLVRPPRGATALLSTGEMSYTADGNYSTYIDVDCTEPNEQTNSEFLLATGTVQLWLQDPLSGTASKMISEVALPCTDASKRAGYSLHRGTRVELDDSNDTHLHYTQPLSIAHTNSYSGEYILEVSPPHGAVVKLNESSVELNITDSIDRNDTLELDCTMAESNTTNGSIKLWEKDMLSGAKAYNYVSYILSCHKTKVLKTGQTTSYTEFDDGYYQTGEERSYTRDDTKEVVVDNVTGLMWQDDSEAKTTRKPWITKANYDAGKYNDTSGDTASTYCANLILGGYDDWRLPTRKELASIVDLGRVYPSLDPEFLNFESDYYWSSTTYAYSSGNAWVVFFNLGDQGNSYKYGSFYVRCVRAGQ